MTAAAERVVKPTPQRRQRGIVERVREQIADAAGDVGHPWQSIGMLDHLERSGAITKQMRQAGDEFHRLFHLAAIDPLKAQKLVREPRAQFGGVEFDRGSERAYRAVTGALDALGGLDQPCGSCAFFVLGLGMSRREWAARQTWRGQNPHSATGTLIGSLGVLAKHFGY